jgi:septal ring factor EnvC (AmiA/AmiB activator)
MATTFGKSGTDLRRELQDVREQINAVRDKRAQARRKRDAARERSRRRRRKGRPRRSPTSAARRGDTVGQRRRQSRLAPRHPPVPVTGFD